MKNIIGCTCMVLLLCIKAFAQEATDFEWRVSCVNDSEVIITGYTGAGGAVVIPETINGMPVTHIAPWAFANKGLISVTIPPSVMRIEEGAFSGNRLAYLIIPGSVQRIGEIAFEANRMTNLTIQDGVTSIGSGAFWHNQLTSVTIPPSARWLGAVIFAGNPITSITIGDNIELNGRHGGDMVGNRSFDNAYNNNGRRAGTYTRPDVESTTWTWQQ